MEKNKIIIYGTGQCAKRFMECKAILADYDIVCFADSNSDKWGTRYFDKKIISPKEIKKLNYDEIIICTDLYYEEIKNQLIGKYQIEMKQIIFYEELKQRMVYRIEEKYKNSNNPEIRQNVSYMMRNGLNVYGSYKADRSFLHEVFLDEDFPYILFENKKMYYPKNRAFRELDGKKYVANILYEQGKNSPHLYITDDHKIIPGDIIVDAGVSEGNFALRYVEAAKKIYLFESDINWIEPLKRTFAPYKDKVVIYSKKLGKYDSFDTITLDSAIAENESIDFLKMDIEGSEIDALLGGKKVLTRSNCRCSICSYHRPNDEENIRFLFKHMNYSTSTSSGYMFFFYDESTAYNLDFRRGMVYAEKNCSSLT